jgi:hypothetical protein
MKAPPKNEQTKETREKKGGLQDENVRCTI